jgi:hypothetical protein
LTIWKKNELEKEIYEALQAFMDGAYYCVRVESYYQDDCLATISVNIEMWVNGAISDLPPFYKAEEQADFNPRIKGKEICFPTKRKNPRKLR